jgi:uncharacterized membrane protein
MNRSLGPFLERIRSSLFFVPMAAVVGAAVLGVSMLAVDGHVDTDAADLPLGFGSTVESARAVLSTIAGATISFAGIAFSVSLLIIQLASSQYSPRVVQTLFRDPFNKRVMALVVGTFTYCVVVLRSVRSAIEPGGDDVIPNVSVAIAVVLGIATILAVVAFIDHNAHAMDVSDILRRISTSTIEQVRATWDRVQPDDPDAPRPRMSMSDPPTVVRAERSGWVQDIDVTALLRCLPDGASARIGTRAGRFALAGSPLITIWTAGSDDALVRAARSTVLIGHTRTMHQDPSYGLRQTVDIAVRALSPGVNDPTTAQDAIFHTAAMLSELLRRDPPDDVTTDESGRVVIASAVSHDELVRLAFDETRRAAARDPAVCRYLLEALDALIESLCADGLTSRTKELARQRRLVVAGCGRTELLDEDIAAIRAAARFGPEHDVGT